MNETPRKLLILGAHPDDAEYHAGGLAARYRRLGHTVKMVSLTDGASGHFRRPVDEMIRLRRAEAAAAGRVIGAAYDVWDARDGELMPTLELRRRVIRAIRLFDPDLVLTHRTNDYHPDHRAVGQLVHDATYLVTVPNILPEVPALTRDPVIAYMADLFTTPCPLVPDVVYDVSDQIDAIVAMLACHATQVFEWLPYQEGILDQVPEDGEARLVWVRAWYAKHVRPRAERFRQDLIAAYGPDRGSRIELCEVYQLSEHAAAADLAERERLFPGGVCRAPRSNPAATPAHLASWRGAGGAP